MLHQQLPLNLPVRFRRRRQTAHVYPERHYWTSIDPEVNRHRYYGVTVEQDLWGNMCAILSWGRINNQPQHRYIWFKEKAELYTLIDRIFDLREAHGYELNDG